MTLDELRHKALIVAAMIDELEQESEQRDRQLRAHKNQLREVLDRIGLLELEQGGGPNGLPQDVVDVNPFDG